MKRKHLKAGVIFKTTLFGTGLAILTSVLVILSSQQTKAQQSLIKPGIFYAITGNGLKDTSYLFGTYHLIKSSYLNEVPAVKKALYKSKGVIIETLIDSAKIPQMQAMGLLKDKKLTSMFDKPFADSLDSELKQSIGVGIAQLDQAKPITVTLTLTMVYALKNNGQKLNQYSGSPLDVYFAGYGKANGKVITPLETMDEQMDLLFNKTSDAEQVRGLKMFVRNKPEMIKVGDELLKSWLANDLRQMDQLYKKSISISGEADYLLKDRNQKWMTVLPNLLKSGGQFIGIGALHLAGEDGIVAQLRNRGFTLTPLKL
jgi:uncharacterized protein YbaP (TraB family)